jgi:serine/threonine protein kinase
LGYGETGIVIYPSLGCTTTTQLYPRDYVSKIMKKKLALQEKKSFERLPDELDGILYYKYCEVCDIDPLIPPQINIVKQFNIEKNEEKIVKNYCILNSTYINGVDLEKVFLTYKSFDNLRLRLRDKKEYPIIPFDLLNQLLLSLQTFNNNVELLNNTYLFFHNDINPKNIMIQKNIKLWLIDFDKSGEQEYKNVESEAILFIIQNVLYMALYIPSLTEIIRLIYFSLQYKKKDNLFLFNNELINYVIKIINQPEDFVLERFLSDILQKELTQKELEYIHTANPYKDPILGVKESSASITSNKQQLSNANSMFSKLSK